MSVLKKFRKKSPSEIVIDDDHKKLPKAYFHGAIKQDENGISYWMEAEDLNELAVLNAEIDDDKDFWKAFADLRRRKAIKPAYTPYRGRKEDFGGEKTYSWTDPSKKKSYMSEWWGGWKSAWTYGGGGRSEQKLALALRSLAVVLDVIDDNPTTRMQVSFSSDNDGPTSYTDFKHNKVVVSPMALLDSKVNEGEGIDITNGFGMHEASHGKYTRAIVKELEAKPIEPMTIASLINNISEDVRIEGLTSEEFPGFTGYFEKMNAFMWERGAKPPTEYGPDLSSKLNAVIGFAKWPQHFPDEKWEPEKSWWRKWVTDYVDGTDDYRVSIEKALAHLRMPTPEEISGGKTKKDPQSESGEQGAAGSELDDITKGEQEAKDFRDFMRDWLKKNRDKIKDFCTHGDHDQEGEQLTEDQARLVQQLVDEEIENHKPPITADGCATPRLIITKPKETPRSKRFWDPRPDAMVSKYREAIRLRPVKPMHTIKLMKEGKVDSTQLWRWAGDDWRVFQQREIAERPAARIYLLIDMSGSMGGDKIEAAQKVARLFLMALKQIDGVNTKVYGHTGDVHESGTSEIYRLWEEGDPMSRLGIILDKEMGNNYDGFAISYVAQQLERDAQPNEQKIVIVLSDGYPAGSGYGGSEAEAHMRKVVEINAHKGIRILQIAIDSALSDGRQARMFREFIPFRPGDRLDEIPRRLTKFLLKVL